MEHKRPDFSSGALEESGVPEVGPVELMVIAIPDMSDVSRIAEALRHLVESSSIRILDVVVVRTESGGAFTSWEFEEVAGLALLKDVEGEVGGWLSTDDIALVCDALPSRTTALVIVLEDAWAAPLAQVVQGCGGRIVGGERIPLIQGTRKGRGRR